MFLTNLHFRSLLLGKILRLNVDCGRKPYGIPKDNLFRKVKGARPEIFAFGFRQPYRMTQDPGNRYTGKVFGDNLKNYHM